MLAFGLTFAALAALASAASYLLFQEAVDTEPQEDEFQAALEAVAAEAGRPTPEVQLGPGDGWALSDPGEEALGGGPILDNGQSADAATENWLIDRVGADRLDRIERDVAAAPTSAAEIDQVLIVEPLTDLEQDYPGLTDDFYSYLQTLRTENGELLFPEPPRGDGDLCLALILECEAMVKLFEATAELEEVPGLVIDEETVLLVNDAYERAQSDLRDRALASQLRIAIMVAVVSTAVAVGAAWIVAQRMLRPVRDMTSVAKVASANTLDDRIGYDGPDDELKELADTFDAMLDRLERAFEAQRRFGSNAAHELKTPLAVMRAEIDAARVDPASTQRELALLDRLDGAATRSEHLVEALLQLALAESGSSRAELVDLAEVAGEAIIRLAPQFDARNLTVELDLGEHDLVQTAVDVDCDPALLDVLVSNLIDNAAKYATAGTTVSVVVAGSVDDVRLVVANDGPVLGPDVIAGLTEPFRRADGRLRTAPRTAADTESGAEGNGLGLSIVAAIAEANGADVELVGPAAGGFEATVRFPAATAATATKHRADRQLSSGLTRA